MTSGPSRINYAADELIIPSFNKNINGSLDEYFVSLEIIEQVKNATVEASWGFEFFSRRDIIPGRRNKTGTLIKLQDIMNNSLNKIVVCGSPGTGKTTLCKKIVYDFYKYRKINDICDDILWIQLRGLKEKTLKGEDFKTIDELVAEYFKIDEDILNFERCIFILDGWDEIHDLSQENIIMNLLKDIISNYKVIVTARPYADLTHIFQHADQVLEIQGFDDLNVRKYIKNVLKSGSKLKSTDEAKILDFLNNSVIADMLNIPILLDIFLFTWEEITEIHLTQLSVTKLYELLVLKLWNEFVQREASHRENLSYNQQSLKSAITGPLVEESFALTKTARKCFESGRLLFSYSAIGQDIDGKNDCKSDCKDALVKTRLLNCIDLNERNREWKRYEFVHLTFCEFFTALNYVHHKKLDEFRDIIAKYKYNITYRFVFVFISGLISSGIHGFTDYTNEEMLNIFFDCLESEPIDLIRTYHNFVIAICLNECAHTLGEKRTTEICKDLSYTLNGRLPKITSLPVVEALIKNKINLSGYLGCRLPNLTDNFYLSTDFSNIDVKTKINILGSQTAFNESSKIKLRELLADVDNRRAIGRAIYSYFTYNCTTIPDFFLIYIFENYNRDLRDEFQLIKILNHIKMTVRDAINVCAYLEPTVSVSDSVPKAIRKLILDSMCKISYIIFLRNTYEFVESFSEILPTLFDEVESMSNADLDEYEIRVKISSIVYVVAMFKVTSHFVLNKFMEVFQKFKLLRPLLFNVIFHLYYKKWLPYSVTVTAVQYLIMCDHTDKCECESKQDHYEHPSLNEWNKYSVLFRNDENILFATDMYTLVCQGLAHTNFQPMLLDPLIDRFAKGAQSLDVETNHLLSVRRLTDRQVIQLIESENIDFKCKYEFLKNQTHNPHVTAFFASNASNLFAINDNIKIYTKIETHFSESERQELVKHSKGYECYHTEHTTLTLNDLTNKIINLNQDQKSLYEACKKYCSDLCFPTFEASVEGISFEKLSPIFEKAFMLPFLSLNQRAMSITNDILFQSGNQCALDIDNKISRFWDRETSIHVLDKMCLEDDVLGFYYFQILENALAKGVISRAYLIKWVSSVNIKHLLNFLIHRMAEFKHALYISLSSDRLCSANYDSHKLGIEDINFICKLKSFSMWLDHGCRQVRKNAISETYTMDKCKTFIIKVNSMDALDEINEKQYRVVQFFNESRPQNLIELFKMLYDKKMLLGSSQDLDMWWSTNYLYYFKRQIQDINFGPYHIDLTDTNITDKMIIENIEKFLFDNEKNVHVLILSNNHITIDGFERLMKWVKECEVKHLFLDGNRIYFDKQRFNVFKALITDPSLQLLTIDLSCNFIAAEWVNELQVLNCKHFTNATVKYILVNNCRVIYQRDLPDSHQGFAPAIDFIAKVDSKDGKDVPLGITQERGCVGYACKKQLFGYSGHVLIFIERMFNGQREVKTAELFQDRNVKSVCKVVIRNTDPFVDHESDGACRESLKSRLLLYNMPNGGPFPNTVIEKLLVDIKDSQDKDNFYEYNISGQNEFENRNNCIKWANDIMKPFVGFEILQIKIPWFYKSSSINFVFKFFQFIICILFIKYFFSYVHEAFY